jgi:hydroxypyruvate reductase
MMPLRDELTAYFTSGVRAASASVVLAPLLPAGRPAGRTIVLGCGKAAAAMAEVAAANLSGDVGGLVVTRYGHGATGATGAIEVIEAGHPVPDAASLSAGKRMRELAQGVTADDRVIFLISGGGSALLCDPIDGVTLADKAAITNHLVKSGVAIGEINLVRRHLSRVKGGRLAAAAFAAANDMHTFLISDVVGDVTAAIASGPSINCRFEPDRALAILAGSGWAVSSDLAAAVHGSAGPDAPTHPTHLIANGCTALDAVAAAAIKDGWSVERLGDAIDGDAAGTGRRHAALALARCRLPGRHLIISGGELTVTVRNPSGRGGPNLEYLTGIMATLPVEAPVAALACDSDGIDGSEDNAGGYFDAIHRASAADCETALAGNLSYDLFERLGTLVRTGPTRTNVNDIRMIAIEGQP